MSLCRVHVSDSIQFVPLRHGSLPLYSVTSSSQRVACGGFVGEFAAVVVDDEQEVVDMLTGLYLSVYERMVQQQLHFCFEQADQAKDVHLTQPTYVNC